MSQLAHETMLYDDFTGPSLDMNRWFFLDLPSPAGPMWRCQEPSATTVVDDGTCTVTVRSFEQSHDTVQIMDNPKHLLLSAESFEVPLSGTTTFSMDMAVTNLGGDAHDYRDGFAAFNVLDMASGMVFDIGATNNHVYAIYEQLPVSESCRPFTYVVENPLAGARPAAGKTLRCVVELDRSAGAARWLVDDLLIGEQRGVDVPAEVKIGIGLFTLHAIEDGVSRSVRGQGLSASWSNPTVVSTG